MTIKTEHAGAKNRGEMPHDQIGYWSEVKPDIIRDYAAAYAKILSAQKNPSLSHVYIDAFAGWGVHKSKTTGNFVPGSPINALSVEPPFREYHFIDLDRKKVASLKKVAYTPSPQMPLWGPPAEEKASNDAVAEAFRIRMKDVAGFSNVPEPIAMRNSQNAVVYYLFFASQKPVAGGIVRDIFEKYRDRGNQ